MSGIGVHFILEPSVEGRILDADGDDDAVEEIVDEIEEDESTERCTTDKAWDAIHRCLTDGSLDWDNGTYPLSAAVLGGRHLYDADDYMIIYLDAGQVHDVAKAMEPLDEAWMRVRYAEIDPEDYDAELGDADFRYTWDNFEDLRDFFRQAADAERAVIFTADA